MAYARSLPILLLMLLPAALGAQTRGLKFQHITVDQGLSQNFVYAIFQDSKGFMWFGTRDGLNKYDGYTFTSYKSQPFSRNSIPSNVVRGIAEDRSGTLWIATQRGGLVRFDRRLERFANWTNVLNDNASLLENDLGTCFIDRDGYLWMAGIKEGIGRMTVRADSVLLPDGKGGRVEPRFTRFATERVMREVFILRGMAAFTQNREGTIFAGGEAGMLRIEEGGRRMIRSDRITELAPINSTIHTVMFDREDRLWVGATAGLYCYEKGKGPARLVWDREPVLRVTEDSTGVLWFASPFGVHTYNPATGAYQGYPFGRQGDGSVVGSIVLSMMTDRAGRVWIGTDGGINRVDHAALRFDNGQEARRDYSALEGYNIRSIVEDSTGLLWLGTAGAGLLCFDRDRGEIVRQVRLPKGGNGNFVNTVLIDRSGRIWCGHRTGLTRVENGEFITYDTGAPPRMDIPLTFENVWALHEDRSGLLWVGTASSLRVVDRARHTVRSYLNDPFDSGSISYNGVWKVLETRDGTIWLGTPGGLDRFDRASERFTRYRYDGARPTTLSHDEVWVLFEDRYGALWVGTWGGGLNRFDRRTGLFTHYMESNGLASNTIHGILEDDAGFLWISSGGGISKLDPRTGTFINFGVADGLPANEYNPNACCRTRDGELLFGGIYGISHFYPARVGPVSTFLPPVVITSFRKLDSVASSELFDGAEIAIEHDENYLSFEFAALDYENPGRIRYAYMLEGLDRDWIYSGNRRYVAYTNLDPGEYTFRVRATNSDGVWNERGLAIHLHVIPPFWRTWQFETLAAALLILGAVAWGARRARRRRQLELALDEAREIERREIAAELHDGPLQDLYSLRFILEPLASTVAVEAESRALEQIDDTLKKVRGSLRNVCGDLQLPSFDCGLEMAIGAHAERLHESFPELDMRLELAPEGTLSQDVRRNLFRAYRSAINNVLKHAGATRITVRLRHDMRCVVLEVEDDGRGFMPPRSLTELMRKKHYGLLLIDAHARSIGGVMEVRSSPGGGALIRVTAEPHEERRRGPGARLARIFKRGARTINR